MVLQVKTPRGCESLHGFRPNASPSRGNSLDARRESRFSCGNIVPAYPDFVGVAQPRLHRGTQDGAANPAVCALSRPVPENPKFRHRVTRTGYTLEADGTGWRYES